MDDQKVCPECGREFEAGEQNCPICGRRLVMVEDFDPREWMVLFHEMLQENVEAVANTLAEHGIEGRVAFIDLSTLEVSIFSKKHWAFLVPRENAETAYNTMQSLYGYTEESRQEDAEAVLREYAFLQKSRDEIADEPTLWPQVLEAMRDPEVPEALEEKAREALAAAGPQAEDAALAALVEEIRDEHFSIRPFAFEPLLALLAEIGTTKTEQTLLELCTGDDSLVRLNAVHCFGAVGSPQNAKSILPLLEDEDDDVRQETNTALEELTGQAAYPEHIFSSNQGRRARAAWEQVLRE